MRERRRCRSVLAGGVVAAMILGIGPVWSKGSRAKDGPPALWIAADRVVGFVPFTVSLYGKVLGSAEPARLELCRELAMQADVAGSRGGMDDPMAERPDRNTGPPAHQDPLCATGTLVRTRDGFDYSHEMRFDRPGTYRVRLSMADASGHRVMSNTVQVNAL
ncbi:MAG TPA: hypothetical protein VEW47_14655 [Candidatus Dormibacteraeota bacterium]|nr:hypothetical protein [Candidatus Dormibacteraeota bacterium]